MKDAARNRKSIAIRQAYIRLLIGTSVIILLLVIALFVSQDFFSKQFSAVKFDVHSPPSLNDNGLWGPKLNHERLLLRLENEFVNASEDTEDAAAAVGNGLMNERWLDLGPALFYRADTIELRAEYHVLLALYAAEAGDRRLFDSVLRMIEDNLVLEGGLLRSARRTDAANSQSNLQDEQRNIGSEISEKALLEDKSVWLDSAAGDDIDFYSSLIYMRALASAHQSWGDSKYLAALSTTSEAYLARSENDLPPVGDEQIELVPTPAVFVGEEGSASPTPSQPASGSDEQKKLEVIRLADIDLYSLNILRTLDPQYDRLYENSKQVLLGAQREGLAIFAQAYDVASSSYIHYIDEPLISLDEQLKIMMSLAEEDLLPPASLAWLKSRLNNYELVESYSLQDVMMVSNETLPLRYGQICRIARITSDQELYAASLDRLLDRNISTIAQSPIYGLIFRHPTEYDDVQVALSDNVWALLGSY